MVKSKRAATCRQLDGGEVGGGGESVAFVVERTEGVQKGGEDLFFLRCRREGKRACICSGRQLFDQTPLSTKHMHTGMHVTM